jgi:hypothetical protein
MVVEKFLAGLPVERQADARAVHEVVRKAAPELENCEDRLIVDRLPQGG